MRGVAVIAVTLAALVSAGTADASQLIDRGATGIKLAVNTKGEALLTYRVNGSTRRVLAWGAVDARQPTSAKPQVRFRKDYAGGWGKYRTQYWRTLRNACGKYTGPKLAFLVTACAAPDGSYWAVQGWRTALPDLGMIPWVPQQRLRQLHLSHWSGPLARIEAWTDWVHSGRFHEVFGRLTYDGKPVYGFGTTRTGVPTDGYGRLIYLDTFNSRYGKGWWRENSFVSHNPTGVFCYGFFRFDPTKGYPHSAGYPSKLRGPGNGAKYRLSVNGPGVTPDVSMTIAGLHDFDRNSAADVAYEQQQNAILDSIVSTDKLCRRH